MNGSRAPKLVGGSLCLDFVNTVDPRHAEPREEHLPDYKSLLGWGRHTGLVTSKEADALAAAARRRPDAARRAHAEAIALRETLYSIFGAVARGEACRPRFLRELDERLADALPKRQLVSDAGVFAWEWVRDDSLDSFLRPVVWSAAELLVHGRLERVRECPGDGSCGWLFLDASKNGSRRWCDMSTCGNRAKARRHYRRATSGRP